MQKALILALLIGAFFSYYVTAQENPGLLCPDNEGTFLNHPDYGPICSQAAPFGVLYQIAAFSIAHGYTSNPSEHCQNGAESVIKAGHPTSDVLFLSASYDSTTSPVRCRTTYQTRPDDRFNWSSTRYHTITYTPGQNQYYCPPDNAPTLRNVGGEGSGTFCWKAALDEPPEECDDIVGNCEPDPECVNGGNGMQVCAKDPDETCDSYTHNGNIYYDCPVGCGFIEGSLYCTTDPDSDGEIPDLSNCFKVATGWACPSDSPTPDDNIDNPEKPLPDMNKGDFKQVNIGIETRLDGTNDLLSDLAAIGKANAEGLADLNSKSLAGNKKLDDIIKNTGATVDALTGDGESADFGDGATFRAEIANALGITGEETIEDLTVAEIDLDDFKGEFSWSIGSSQCPQPRAINMLGRTFYMDWDPFCQAFTIMGYLILAAAYFFSTLIAFKGK